MPNPSQDSSFAENSSTGGNAKAPSAEATAEAAAEAVAEVADELALEPTPSQPASLARGVKEFNTEQFYACHDTLEAVWMAAEQVEKPFYQGILQISVAFYHLGNSNWRGGAILLGEGISRLRKFEPTHEGVDVEALVDEAVEWLTLVQEAGPEGVAKIMSDLPRSLPKIQRI